MVCGHVEHITNVPSKTPHSMVIQLLMKERDCGVKDVVERLKQDKEALGHRYSMY